MSTRQRRKRDFSDDQPATQDRGPDSRHKARLPEGRGPSPLLVLGIGGAAELILPHRRRAKHLSDAELAVVNTTIARLNGFNRESRLPTAGCCYITESAPVQLQVPPEWVQRQRHNGEVIAIRVIPNGRK
jgi:hypothetical protein